MKAVEAFIFEGRCKTEDANLAEDVNSEIVIFEPRMKRDERRSNEMKGDATR